MRLATPADAADIVELYRGLSPFSQRMRFSASVSEEALLRAASVDGRTDAVIALSGGRLIGEARMDTSPHGDHEFAVTVADGSQGRGVGAVLLDALRERARDRGIVTLRAQVRTDNVRMLTLLRRVGGAIVLVSDGDVLFDIASDRQMPGWPGQRSTTKVLVEAPGALERPVTTALRAAGYEVRQCAGPSPGRREPCPLLAGGTCRLAAEADAIICLLPENHESKAVVSAHALDRPSSLNAGYALCAQ
jgi:GNAT superfamily N-acetyltransferase